MLTGMERGISAWRICGIPRKWRQKGKRGRCRYSIAGLEMRLGDWKGRVGRRVRITDLFLSLLGQVVHK